MTTVAWNYQLHIAYSTLGRGRRIFTQGLFVFSKAERTSSKDCQGLRLDNLSGHLLSCGKTPSLADWGCLAPQFLQVTVSSLRTHFPCHESN